MSILEGLLGRILAETASEWYGINRVWTTQARADRMWAIFGKGRPRAAPGSHWGTFLTSFWVPGAAMGPTFEQQGGTAGPVAAVLLAEVWKLPHLSENQSKSEGKVYLSDNSYD